MEAKEKALEIYNNLITGTNQRCLNIAKKHSLILVDEIINEYQSMSDLYTYLSFNERKSENSVVERLIYWNNVKIEIKNLTQPTNENIT